MPVMAFCEMSLPHDGPMNELVTFSTGTSYASASAFLTSVDLVLGERRRSGCAASRRRPS